MIYIKIFVGVRPIQRCLVHCMPENATEYQIIVVAMQLENSGDNGQKCPQPQQGSLVVKERFG